MPSTFDMFFVCARMKKFPLYIYAGTSGHKNGFWINVASGGETADSRSLCKQLSSFATNFFNLLARGYCFDV